MLKNDKISKVNLIKSSLLKLGKAAISKKLLDILFIGSAGVTATSATAPISIPFIAALFVAYAGINYFEEKDKAAKQKIIIDEFDRRLDDIRDYLRNDRETQLAEVSHILEIELQQEEVIDLINYLKEKTDNQNIEFEDISQQIGFTAAMLGDFKTQLETHLASITKKLITIDETTARTELKIEEYTEEFKEYLDEGFKEQNQDIRSIIQKEIQKITTAPQINANVTQANAFVINVNIASMSTRDNDFYNKLTESIQDKFLSNETNRKSFWSSINKNIFELFNKIQLQMTYQNYAEALELSKELETYAENLHINDIKPYIQVLLARLVINHIERGINCTNEQSEKAKRLLKLAEQHATGELCDRIDALKAIVMEFEGTDTILNLLGNKTNPYAMRARLASLIKNKKYADAIKLIEEQKEIHECWADPAIIVFLCQKEDKKAKQILERIKFSSNHSLFIACSVKYAEILSLRLAQFEQEKAGLDCKQVSEKILEVLNPVLQEASRPDLIKGIYGIANEIALKANLVLGNIEGIKKYSNLLITCTPIPLIVLECIIRQLIPPPENILKRIRDEHKTNINAHLLAVVIQTQCFKEPQEAFLAFKEVINLAKTEKEKASTLNCLLELWQHLDVKLADDCYRLAMSLSKTDSLSENKFKAGKYLRENQPDKTLEIFKDQPENDPVVLQMKGNAYLQKKQFDKAAHYFQKTAELVNSSEMYHKAGDFFIQGNKLQQAIECYEKSIFLYPDNIAVVSSLADIYTYSYTDLNKALKYLTALDSLQPDESKVLINIAACYARLFEPEKSLEYYEKACKVDSPMLAAVAGKAELLIAMKRENDAFAHLELYKEQFKSDPEFSLIYMNTAYYAGYDDIADLTMKNIIDSQKKGIISKEIITAFSQDKAMEMFRERAKEANATNKNVHTQMLQGQFPWIWAETINGNKNFYWGWLKRTQELKWLFEDPVNWANLTIYSTNGFHAQKDTDQKIKLLPIKSPPASATIVADISALITLHQLNLLGVAITFFNKVVIPEEYLGTVLNQGKEILPHQKSNYIAAAQIEAFIDNGKILILTKDNKEENIIKVDEYYTESDEVKYHIRDVIESLFASGTIDENIYEEALKVCSKPQALKEDNVLQYKQKIQIELSTLRTLANVGVLEQLCGIYNIYISSDSYEKNTQIIKGMNLQNEAIDKYYKLWKCLKNHPHVEFIRVDKEKNNAANIDVESALLAAKLARKNNWPLLVDDRVLQALVFNESPEILLPVFGTDALILCLQQSEKLSKKESLNSLLKLMKWRYRFIIIPPELLKEAALKYLKYPPGKVLTQIAKYVQECMQDPGLFTGMEKTELGESMASRLYLTWIRNITEFIALLWKDSQIDRETVKKITIWAINVMLPSPPKALHGSQKTNVENSIARQVFSIFLINIWNNNKQIENAIKVIQDCWGLNNEKYSMVILDFLNDVSKILPSDVNEKTAIINQALKESILAIAFSHTERINIRTLISLQQLNLSNIKLLPIGEDIDPEIIRNPKHKKRLPLRPGPLLIYSNEDKTENFIVETKILFCSPSKETRQAVFEYYEMMITTDQLHATPKTRNILKARQSDILAETDSIWKSAAITIYDALNNDVFIFIAGVNQITHSNLKIENLLETYVPEVLYPQMQTLDFTELVVNIPEKEHDKLHLLLKDIVNNSESIYDLCQKYYNQLGHLPLAPQFSLAQVVKMWSDKNKKSDIWDEVWNWADNILGPLPQYHACTVFVLYPELIPDNKLPILWVKIKTIICDSDVNNKDASLYEAWQLRKDMNRHFTYHIEANLPDCDGSQIANFVLWLTEKVSCLFEDNPKSILFYRKEWIANALNASARAWLSAMPSEKASELRYINQVIPAPWALSLMCLMGDHLKKLKPYTLEKELKNDFNNSFSNHLLMAYPFNVNKPKNPTYAFQLSLTNTINNWKKFETKELKKAYNHLLRTNKKWQNNETFMDDFKKISEKTYIDQIFLASVLKHKTFTEPAIEDLISQLISDASWRDKTLLSIHKNVLGIIVEALSLLQVKSRNEWVFHLPHYIADLCEKTEDQETLNYLFYYMIHTCLASDNYSAICRSLTGKNAGKYIEYVKEFMLRIEEMQKDSPFWVKGKLRSLMAAMQIY